MNYKANIAEKIQKHVDLPFEELQAMLEVPPNPEMGDFALPCFKLARVLRKAPPMIADSLKETFETDDVIARVESEKGYLNIFVNKLSMATEVINKILSQGQNVGASTIGDGKTILIDYSSVNIAKELHIGHLSTTVIGHALYRIYEHLGYKVVGINHLGDWGTQFGKLIVAFKTWGDRATVEEKGVEELTRLYVKYHAAAEEDPSMDDVARAWFKKIEDGDEEALELFYWFKDITLKEVAKVYDQLGVTFDSYAGESFYNDKMAPVIEEMKQKNVLVEDQGAMVVRLDDYNMPPCLILKTDGATLYATRDITTAIYRKQHYDFEKCLYVVAYQQDLHFKQFFKVIDLMGHEWAKDLVHVNYGWVSMEDGGISTRKGRVVLLKDVLSRSVEKALSIIEEKNPDLEDKNDVARMIGVGATVFAALKNNRIKDIVFSWDAALNFEGETAPYVQYTHARCNSVLEKATIGLDGEVDYTTLDNTDAQAVITLLSNFDQIIQSAADRYEPSMITRYVIDLAQSYNKYYFDHRIITDDPEPMVRARLQLTAAVKQVIYTALYLLGVEAPNKM